jgi:hypothetical protein
VKLLIFRLLAVVLSSALAFGAIELGYRMVLASPTALGSSLRDPGLYADSLSQDTYWKLHHRWIAEYRPPADPHPLLGWVGSFDPETMIHEDASLVGTRRPLLLYGDSFAQGMHTEDRFEAVFATRDEFSEFTADHWFLNYGVGGYGIDQAYLALRESVGNFADPFVIFSFFTYDIDRCLLSVRTGQKPYFVVVDGELALRGVPIHPDGEAFFRDNPPRIGSYVGRRMIRSSVFPRFIRSLVRADAEIRRSKQRVVRAILDQVVADLGRRGVEHGFLVFQSVATVRGRQDWRDVWLREELARFDAPVVFSGDLLQQEVSGLTPDELFIPGNRHPTTAQNEILARAMRDMVLASTAE